MPGSESEQEPQRSLKRVTWQSENCLSCVWFAPNDPLNADAFERGMCNHAKLKEYELVVSGRDWCNLYTEIRQRHIDVMQEKASKE